MRARRLLSSLFVAGLLLYPTWSVAQEEVRISGVSYALTTGEAIVMPANEPHALRATKRFKMLLTMVRA